MSIVLLLQMMGGWNKWGCWINIMGGATGGGYHVIVFVFV